MTQRRNFKRLVRARMRKTGESYTAARARVLGHAGPPPSHGGGAMHPFERLSVHARQALDLARWHALDQARDEIDTDSLAWALLRQTEGGAAAVLARMRGSSEPPPPGWQRGGGDERRPGVTARMKQTIRRAYEEAANAGARRVGSEHLLLGLLEADPDAALALGVVTTDLVRLQVQDVGHARHFPSGAMTARSLPEMSPELSAVMTRSATRGRRAQDVHVQLAHVLQEIGEATQLRAVAVLLDRLGGPARPPGAAMELIWELEDVQRRKAEARQGEDDALIDLLTDQEARLQREVYVALSAWHAGLRGPGHAAGTTAAPD